MHWIAEDSLLEAHNTTSSTQSIMYSANDSILGVDLNAQDRIVLDTTITDTNILMHMDVNAPSTSNITYSLLMNDKLVDIMIEGDIKDTFTLTGYDDRIVISGIENPSITMDDGDAVTQQTVDSDDDDSIEIAIRDTGDDCEMDIDVTENTMSNFTITFDGNGGYTTQTTMTTNNDGRVSILPNAVRDGYMFDGWYTDPVNGTKVTTSTVFTSNTTVYAHWTKESTSDNEHNISNVWSTDADSHWHTCSCGERHDLSAHTATDWIIDKPATADSVGQMHKQCSVCGYLLESSEIPVVEEDDNLDWSWILLDLMRREYTITANANEGGTITNEGELTVKFDSSATYEIVPDDGYYIDAVIVDGDDIGAVSTYTFDGISSDHTIEAVFAEIEWENPYNDVSKDDWFYDAIKYVTENGLMNGVGSGMFMPYATSERAMIVTILWRLEGMPNAENTIEFSDVHNGDWYYDAVMWASENKIVEGYGDTTFRPDTPITHEQLAAILYRYAVYKGYNTTAREVLTDNIIISDWATDAVEWANAVKLLDLFQLKEYLPREVVARCQMAYILMQFCALYVE